MLLTKCKDTFISRKSHFSFVATVNSFDNLLSQKKRGAIMWVCQSPFLFVFCFANRDPQGLAGVLRSRAGYNPASDALIVQEAILEKDGWLMGLGFNGLSIYLVGPPSSNICVGICIYGKEAGRSFTKIAYCTPTLNTSICVSGVWSETVQYQPSCCRGQQFKMERKTKRFYEF